MPCNGDGTCDAGESCQSCSDCPSGSGAACGNGVRKPSEDGDSVISCRVSADCDDGIACTNDDCVAQNCVNTPDDAECPDDGQFCNETESFDPVSSCVSSGGPCSSGTVCTEGANTCDPVQCGQKNDSCTDNLDCCWGVCKPNGRCK